MRVGVTGATGRMGRTVREVAAERGDEVAFAASRDPTGDLDAAEEFPELLVSGILTRS